MTRKAWTHFEQAGRGASEPARSPVYTIFPLNDAWYGWAHEVAIPWNLSMCCAFEGLLATCKGDFVNRCLPHFETRVSSCLAIQIWIMRIRLCVARVWKDLARSPDDHAECRWNNFENTNHIPHFLLGRSGRWRHRVRCVMNGEIPAVHKANMFHGVQIGSPIFGQMRGRLPSVLRCRLRFHDHREFVSHWLDSRLYDCSWWANHRNESRRWLVTIHLLPLFFLWMEPYATGAA